MEKKWLKLGQILIADGIITENKLNEALLKQENDDRKLGLILLELGYINKENLYKALSKQYNVTYLTFDQIQKDGACSYALNIIPEIIAQMKSVLPLAFDSSKGIFKIVVADPTNQEVVGEMKVLAKANAVHLYVSDPETIERCILKFYSESKSAKEKKDISAIADRTLYELKALDKRLKGEKEIGYVGKKYKFIKDFKAEIEQSGIQFFWYDQISALLDDIGNRKFKIIYIEKSIIPEKERPESIKREILNKDSWAQVSFVESFGQLFYSDPISYDSLASFSFNLIDYIVTFFEPRLGEYRGHAHNVARYSEKIAQALNLPKPISDEIKIAAFIHDIAKILHQESEDSGILLFDDYQIMYNKNVDEFIKLISPSTRINSIIKCLNEHYNGEGRYGLKANEIPIGARIISVIDMFEEISKHETNHEEEGTSNKELAFRGIRKEASKSLDPEIVEAFINVVKGELTIENISKSMDTPKKVLFADEMSYDLNLMRLRLINEGIKVFIEQDPEQAYKIYKKYKPQIIICSDSSIETFQNKVNKETCLLAFTENKLLEQSEEIMAKIEKPVDIEKFDAIITSLFNKIFMKEERITSSIGFFKRSGNYYQAADLYRELGDLSKAAKMYIKAEDFNQAAKMYLSLEKYNEAGLLYEKTQDLNLALECFQKSENLIKQNEILIKEERFYEASLNLYSKNRYEQAIKLLQKVKKDSRDYKEASILLGNIFFIQKRYTLAIRFLEKIVLSEELNDENIINFYKLALAYETNKDFNEALEIYEKILGKRYDFEDVLSRVDKIRKMKHAGKEKEELEKEAGRFLVPEDSKSGSSKRYDHVKEIGKGGMGVVYLAKDLILDRMIALKVLYANLQTNKRIIETFIREAKSAASLNHINIVTVYDAGIDQGNYYIAMEFIDGSTIREIIKRKKLSIQNVIAILKQICRGLDYAHANHIVHRDLTTNNIMLSKNGVVKIMDFGLARVIRSLMSEQSIIGGTPSYMSPEQVDGDPIDHRTDIYTLGVTLFEMTTNQVPFTEGNIGYHHLNTPPPTPISIEPSIPKYLNDIILRCLEKKPDNRYQNVSEILLDIQD
ncbi:MAG: protein kinase [Pseudomonadota bacterium]